jgi:hypothetical protein
MAKSKQDPEAGIADKEDSKKAKVIGTCPKELMEGVADMAGKLGEKEVTIVSVGKNAVVFQGASIGMKKFPQAE